MRNLKRVLSLALAVVMVIGMMVMTTGAADFTDAGEINYAEAVDVAAALGLIEGIEAKDGTYSFNPDGILTREGAAKLICYMLMGPENAEKLVGTSNFTDVKATRWSAPYISYCVSLGYIAGNGDGTFNPTGKLTGVAFAKLLLCALGYDPVTEGYVNNKHYATNIGSDAIEAGINIDGVDMAAQLTREQAAQMILNTMTADMVEYTGGMSITTPDGTSINAGAIFGNKVQGNYNSYKSDGTTYVGTADLQFCEKYFPNLKLQEGKTANGMDYREWYLSADATLAATESVTTADEYAVVATYTTGVEKITLKALAALVGDGVTMDVYENGDNTNPADVTTDKTDGTTKPFSGKYEGATVEIIKNTGASAGTYIVNVTYGYLAKVTAVTDATATADRFVTMTVYNNSTTVTGVNYITDEYAEGDLLMVYPNGDITATAAWDNTDSATGFNYDGAGDDEPSCNILAVEPIEGTVEGKLTAQENSNATLTLGGTAYVPAAAALGVRGVDNAATDVLNTTYTTGTTYEFVLSNGYLFGFADAEVVNQIITDLVFIDAVHTVTGKYGTAYEVVTITMGGEVKVIETTTNLSATTAGIYKLNYTAGALTSVTAVAVDDIDNSTYYYGGNVLKTGETLDDKVTYVVENASADEDRLHISEKTKIFYVDGAYNTGDLKVTAYDAIPKLTTASTEYGVASLALDGAYDLEVLILDDTTLTPVVIPGEAVYYSTGTSLKGEVYVDGRKVAGTPATTAYQHEVYNIVTGQKETIVTVDTSNIAVGFYKVTADEWGVLTTTTTGAPAAATDDDVTGVYSTTLTDTITLERGYLSITGGTYTFTDAVVGEDTVVINAIGGGNTMTLAQFVAAQGDAATATAKIYISVDAVTSAKDVVCVILTGYTAS